MTFIVSMKTLNELYVFDGVYTLFKKLLAILHGFIKRFHLQQSRNLRFSMVQQFLSCLQRIISKWFSVHLIRKKFPFNLLTTYPQKKCHHKKNHAYLNLVCSIYHSVDIYRLEKPDFFFLLLFLVSSIINNIPTFSIDDY